MGSEFCHPRDGGVENAPKTFRWYCFLLEYQATGVYSGIIGGPFLTSRLGGVDCVACVLDHHPISVVFDLFGLPTRPVCFINEGDRRAPVGFYNSWRFRLVQHTKYADRVKDRRYLCVPALVSFFCMQHTVVRLRYIFTIRRLDKPLLLTSNYVRIQTSHRI